jgi:hypothetical protein
MIEKLADFSAIQQLRGALWGTSDSRGAAVLVGAGFSRNAILPSASSPEPPLWFHFTREMNKRLYPTGGAPSDPLRLAEEYRTILGQPALESLIFDLIRDGEWLPGLMHQKLMTLPWVDVLTTNWDTLLERAAESDPERSYEVIRSIPDISRTRAPRIVKLHGSMPSNRPFIFAEEDYRTYPKVFAPFVNLVQQVLLENELCLIGFSGDDPNFLQWSGWVRDQLGASARRIHLIGVLNLSTGRRKFLEARNVSPIDLAPLVEGVDDRDKHRIATERFLDYLISSKPRPASEWLSKGGTQAERLAGAVFEGSTPFDNTVKSLVEAWKREREEYPGWLVCPSSYRTRIRIDFGNIEYKLTPNLSRLSETLRVAFLYELVWRLETALLPIPNWVRDPLAAMLETDGIDLTRSQRLEVAISLLRNARSMHDAFALKRWSEFALKIANSDEDEITAVQYENALWARDFLDTPTLASLLPKLKGRDPVWLLRRAGLLCEIGDFQSAWNDSLAALREIRGRQARDRNSLWIRSRAAWAMFLARSVRMGAPRAAQGETLVDLSDWPEYLSSSKCDPWDELQSLDRNISEGYRAKADRSRNERPQFDAGRISRTVSFGGITTILPAIQVPRLADSVGLPIEAGAVNVMRSRLSEALELLDERDERDLSLCIRSLSGTTDNMVDIWFGRVEVARMPQSTATNIESKLLSEIEHFWRRLSSSEDSALYVSGSFWEEKIQIYAEIASRLFMRLKEPEAVAAFRMAVKFAHDRNWRHWTLFEPLRKMLERSLEAISPVTRATLLTEVLSLPLPDEHGIAAAGDRGVENEWPEVVGKLPAKLLKRPQDNGTFAERVSTLISKAEAADPFTRERAVLRLSHLFEAGVLTEAETKSFGNAIWCRRASEDGLPADLDFLPHAYFILPKPKHIDFGTIFRQAVVAPRLNQPLTVEFLADLAAATRLRRDRTRYFALTTAESGQLLNSILNWKSRNLPFVLDTQEDRIKHHIGETLADAVLPIFDPGTLSSSNLDGVLTLAESLRLPSTLVALPEVLRIEPARAANITRLIHKCLFDRDDDVVVYAIRATRRWWRMSSSKTVVPLPEELHSAVMSRVMDGRGGGLYSAMLLAGELIASPEPKEADLRAVSTGLEGLRLETAYERWNVLDPRTPTITLIRAECAKLAYRLKQLSIDNDNISFWLNLTDDPVPEVRYSLSELEPNTTSQAAQPATG